MHAWLLFEDRDTEPSAGYSFPNDLIKDFQLDIVIRTMGGQSEQMRRLVKGELMHPLKTGDQIRYRQEIIADFVKNQEAFTELYAFLQKTEKTVEDYRERERLRRGSGKARQAAYYIDKLNCLVALTGYCGELHSILEQSEYESRGMQALKERFLEEYPKERLDAIASGLHELEFWLNGGVLTISGRFCEGMKLGDFVVNQVANIASSTKRPARKLTLMEQISKAVFKTNVTMLQEETLLEQGKNLEEEAAGWLLTAFDSYLEDLLDFFGRFYYEGSFYMGCVNLVSRFREWNLYMCVPEVAEGEDRSFAFEELYDLNLAIYSKKSPVGNKLNADNVDLFVVTGANQGGKSTWLRSVGGAQILMQCGMLVPAWQYKNRIYTDIFTHFGRQEDREMNSGRFDEELCRMDKIMDHMTMSSVLFMNESFASTTETEGAMIHRNITDALYELRVPVFAVTHLFEYTQELYQRTKEQKERMMFLSAERTETTARTYRIEQREPSPTSYGLDLYREMIGELSEIT